MMFSQDTLGKILCARECVLAVSILLKNKPKTIKLCAVPNQYDDGKSLLLSLMYFLSHTETGLSEICTLCVCVCVCDRPIQLA